MGNKENGSFIVPLGDVDDREFLSLRTGQSVEVTFSTGASEETYYSRGYGQPKYSEANAPDDIRIPRCRGDIFEVIADNGQTYRLDLKGSIRFGIRAIAPDGILRAGVAYRITRSGKGMSTRYVWSAV